MKKILLFAICVLVALSLFGCYDNDDFAPYENYSRAVNTVISTEMEKLSDIIPDIDKIAHQQQSNLILTTVKMIFEGLDECNELNGKIIFGYAKPHETRNQVSKMLIYYDMKNKTIEKFDWEKGHGKRVSYITDEIGDKYIHLSMSDITKCFNQDSEYISKINIVNPQLRIELEFNRLYAYLHDLDTPNSEIVFRYDSAKVEEVTFVSEPWQSAEEVTFVAGPWQSAYSDFLKNSANYTEDGHSAGTFALADLNNNGVPELIIGFFNGIEGGYIFANVYSYTDNINRIGQRIDMYYKGCWFSSDPTFPGVFAEGGRNSTFACNYWTIKDDKFVHEPLWTDAYDSNTEKMKYEELSSNKKLITEAKKVTSSNPEGTVEFFEISENDIQKVLLSK